MNSLNAIIPVATITPRMKLGNPAFNAAQTIAAARSSKAELSLIVIFPELGLTGYTLGDLMQQPVLLDRAKQALVRIAESTKRTNQILVTGLPLDVNGRLYNCAAVVGDGKILGIVPKTYLPNYQEFYEARWFTSADYLTHTELPIGNQIVPIGTDLLFEAPNIPGLTLGVEICEDLWVPVPPSSLMSPAGATVIANLSASNELAGKADYRRDLVVQQSARLRAAYLYASAGADESTMDVVFSGHSLIASNGQLLAEAPRYARDCTITLADIDLEHLAIDRRRAGTFQIPASMQREFRRIELPLQAPTRTKPFHSPNPHPFIPAAGPARDARTQEIFNLQAAALASRLEQSGIRDILLGLSGGLDSTLALLVAVRALHMLGEPLSRLHPLTLPGMATSGRTKSNAHKLGEALGLKVEEIAISPGSKQQLRDLGHDGMTQDPTYQNIQARYRTSLLLGRANQLHAMVLGTGDLSEIALGWATFNGDHISHYHVNAGVPKTLVKYLVSWAADQPEFTKARDTLIDIIDTPISPELTTDGTGGVDQSTEELIGPYELTDFYLYHFIRWGESPDKILALAEAAFGSKYTKSELARWLDSFINRFFRNQWKRSVMPDGPKIGSVSLSPRGDWRMPSAMSSQTWSREVQ